MKRRLEPSRSSAALVKKQKSLSSAATVPNDLGASTSAKRKISSPKTPKKSNTQATQNRTLDTYLVKNSPSSQKRPALKNQVDLTAVSDDDTANPFSASRQSRSFSVADMAGLCDEDAAAPSPSHSPPPRRTVRPGSGAGPLSRTRGMKRKRQASVDDAPAASTSDDEEGRILIKRAPRPSRKTAQAVAESSGQQRRDAMTDESNAAEKETVETGSLEVYGETCASDDEDDEDDEIIVPVRVLDDFVVFESDSGEPVPLGELLDKTGDSYGATGIVKAYVSEDDSDEDDSEDDNASNEEDPHPAQHPIHRLRIPRITGLNVHYCRTKVFSEPGRPEEYRIDEKIYLLTPHAWYILATPNPSYRQHFGDFVKRHCILHLLVTKAQADSRLTIDGFRKALDDHEGDAVGAPISSEDLDDRAVRAHLAMFLAGCAKELRVGRVPAIKKILELVKLNVEAPAKAQLPPQNQTPAPASALKRPTSSAKPSDPVRPPPSKKCRLSQPIPSRPTSAFEPATGGISRPASPRKRKAARMKDIHVEPIVKRIAQEFMEREVIVSQHLTAQKLSKEVRDTLDHVFHRGDPDTIKPGKTIRRIEQRNYYDSIVMDGFKYQIGHCVIVNPGEDEDKGRQVNAASKESRSANELANKSWFGIIRALCKDPEQGYLCHLQWFEHASKTVLQEMAHSRGLFLLMECEDVPVATIFRRVHVDLYIRGEEPEDDKNPTGEHFHCAHVYDSEATSFTTAPSVEETASLCSRYPDLVPCLSCCEKRRQDDNAMLKTDGNRAFSQYGADYHVGDTVYLAPKAHGVYLYRIGQIVAIKGDEKRLTVSIRILLRQQDQQPPSASDLEVDDRCLFFGMKVETIQAKVGSEDPVVHGKCYIKNLHDAAAVEDWIQHEDHFYAGYHLCNGKLEVLEESDLRPCARCLQEHEEDLADTRRLQEKHGVNGKLRGLELFAGGGGLGKGLEDSGFVNTTLAVDYEPPAAETYRRNHSHVTVLCADSNNVLKAVRGHTSARDVDGNAFPSLPQPCTADEASDIDFLYGGPPCQSFSRANHYKDPNDIRSYLPLNMLSFAEAYRPDYFLLENVRGLLDFRLERKGPEDDGGSIKNSMVKIILRTLIALGYQASIKVLQAGQYGIPQRRERVIFLGAKLGLPMPLHPLPTHAFPNKPNCAHLSDGTKLTPVTRSLGGKDPEYLFAPLPPVCIEDAIGDLPRFEWIDPSLLRKPLPEIRRDMASMRQGILQVDARKSHVVGFVGFPEPAKYHCCPRNRYQATMQTPSGKVALQFTRAYDDRPIAQCVAVPFEPGADGRRLPRELQPGGKGADSRHGSFGRCGGQGYFETIMTTPEFGAKGSWLLHPTLARPYSIREAARAQTFPDDYVFYSLKHDDANAAVHDLCRIAGNAVPVLLAKKLGQSIGAAMVKRWKAEEQRGSPEL